MTPPEIEELRQDEMIAAVIDNEDLTVREKSVLTFCVIMTGWFYDNDKERFIQAAKDAFILLRKLQ